MNAATRPSTVLLANGMVAGLAAALFLWCAPAHGATNDASSLTQGQKAALNGHVAACDKLSGHEHGNARTACVDHARRDFTKMEPSLTPAQKARLEQESAHYQSAVNACNKRPVSERGACTGAAANDYRLAGLK
jgi:hypothetical protein